MFQFIKYIKLKLYILNFKHPQFKIITMKNLNLKSHNRTNIKKKF